MDDDDAYSCVAHLLDVLKSFANLTMLPFLNNQSVRLEIGLDGDS
jgi:hypothetical protein